MAVLGLHDSIADEDHPPAVGGDSGSGGGFDPVVIGKLNGATRGMGSPGTEGEQKQGRAGFHSGDNTESGRGWRRCAVSKVRRLRPRRPPLWQSEQLAGSLQRGCRRKFFRDDQHLHVAPIALQPGGPIRSGDLKIQQQNVNRPGMNSDDFEGAIAAVCLEDEALVSAETASQQPAHFCVGGGDEDRRVGPLTLARHGHWTRVAGTRLPRAPV